MTKRSINPKGLAPPVGPYAHVVTVPPGGRLVYCAGTVAFDEQGEIVGVGDVVAQTERTMENLKLALEAADASFDDVVKVTNYVIDARDYPKWAPVRERYLREPYPASAMVEVKALLCPELLIEIEAIAVVHD